MEICRVPKVDGSLTLLSDEVADFAELISVLESYRKFGAAGVKPSQSQLEQWAQRFVSFILEHLGDSRSHQVAHFLFKALLDFIEGGN